MKWAGQGVLITGGFGFIGSNLARRLLSVGAHVAISDTFFEGGGANRFNLQDAKVETFGDFSTVDFLNKELPRFQVIFDLAAQTGHQASMQKPFEDLELNGSTHLRLLEACRTQGLRPTIIFTSTRQIYGRPQYLPVDEKHPIVPVDINGIHKLAAENYFALYSSVYGIPSLSLRLTNTYGPRQLIRSAAQGVVGWFINRAINNETIELFDGGDQLRDFTEVEDVVDALLLSAEAAQKAPGGSYNLSGEKASLAKVAEIIVTAVGRGQIVKKPFPPQAKKIDIGDYYGTSAEFEKLTDWRPRISLAEGLSKMAQYYQQNSAHYLGPFSR